MTIAFVPYQPSFLDPFMEWRSQPSSVAHNPIRQASREEIGEWLAADGVDLSEIEQCDSFRWFITVNGRPVGQISLKEINLMMNYAEIGYGIAEEFQGRGLATMAVRFVCDKIFRETPLRKLMAYVHDTNIASCRVLEKCGFVCEGLLREHYIINGRPENEIIFAILKREWHGNHSNRA